MLKGRLVELRPVSRTDLPQLNKWNNDEELVTLGSGSNAVFQNNNPLEALEAHYAKNLTSHDDMKDGTVFSVYTKEGQHIGKCDYRDINPITRSATIGLLIGEKDYWGRGYGKDIIQTLLHFLFNTLNLERVQLDTWSGNTQAVRCYEKCGFSIEGRLRSNEYVNGTYYDTIIMGILRENFSKE